jgi:hypothetical protein
MYYSLKLARKKKAMTLITRISLLDSSIFTLRPATLWEVAPTSGKCPVMCLWYLSEKRAHDFPSTDEGTEGAGISFGTVMALQGTEGTDVVLFATSRVKNTCLFVLSPPYSDSLASVFACARAPLRSMMTHFPWSKIRPTTH